MKELYSHETILKFENEIAVGEKLAISGYEYTKTSTDTYENSSTIIEVHRDFGNPYTTLNYKSKKKSYSQNAYGQKFKKNQF
ncbi:MAG TPA: hypothetical protein DCP90_03240 [Clostridiales bacterium]|nr:hypothetical protein [Clostridiales bacterium]